MPGLEHSSTSYSIAMVIEHVAIVNRDIASLLAALVARRLWDRVVSTADYKPRGLIAVSHALHRLGEANTDLERILSDCGAICAATGTHAHPWFGELPASSWASFPGFHGAIHLKQARAISAGLR